MSERLKNTTQTSNEEVISDLTKDLKSSLSTEEFVINPETSTEANSLASAETKHKQNSQSNFEDVPLNAENETEYEKDPDKDSTKDDSDTEVDEESLKDAEVDLTDDQKEERRIIAEELKVAGNDIFKIGDYDRSIEKYTEGLRICPLQFAQLRSILYCNRSAARMKLKEYPKAIRDCTKAIELDGNYIKAFIRRAQSYEETEKFDEALADFKKILELDSMHREAKQALTRLPPLIEAKNEKLKTEMMGKLKDLGNMILKPFGLSTENFQMEQDPETKGYKINFKQ